MDKYTITLDGHLFRRAYLLYIIELIFTGKRHYYVGQTGDRRYITARPAFRRLMGHFEDVGRSTQNQLYRYVAADLLQCSDARERVSFSEDVKQQVEDVLAGSTVHMHVYSLEPFRVGILREQHLEVLHRVEDFERHVIKRFKEAGFPLANRNVHSPRTPIPYPEVFREIEMDFGLRSTSK